MQLVLQPFSEQALGDLLQAALKGNLGPFDSFHAAIAFVKRSGTQHVTEEIGRFLDRGGRVRMVVGVDQHGTSIEGLTDLLTSFGGKGELWVNHEEGAYVTFHPKVYLFEGPGLALVIIGSGNLTAGGLYSNDEASAVFSLNLQKAEDAKALQEVQDAIARWCDPQFGTARLVDSAFLQALIEEDYVRPEAQTRPESDGGAPEAEEPEGVQGPLPEEDEPTTLFAWGPARRRPARRRPETPPERTEALPPISPSMEAQGLGFVMTLMKTDVGVGQTTPGAARRSPEVFIPLGARDARPGFWGWQDKFTQHPTKPRLYRRYGVPMRIASDTLKVNMMTWPDKHDFRLRTEALRSAGNVGDILRIERTDEALGYSYFVEIVPQGTSEFDRYRKLCVNRAPNSDKEWGYYSF